MVSAFGAAVDSGDLVIADEGAVTFDGYDRFANNGGIYRGDDVNHSGCSDPAPTVLMKDARYEKLIEAFGGDGYYAADPKELATALTGALAAGKPALINCPIDPKAGTESGHIGNLNPQSSITEKK